MWAIPRLVKLLQPFDNFGHFFHVQRPPDHDRVPACSGSDHGDNFRQTAPGNVSIRKVQIASVCTAKLNYCHHLGFLYHGLHAGGIGTKTI